MRADARANRQAVVEAARWVFTEEGTSVAMERVAARAGVGIATLYRRFPKRHDLVRAVIVDMLEAIGEATERARAESGGDAAQAWELFVRSLARLRFGLLVPTLARHLAPSVEDDAELLALAEERYAAAADIFERAQQAGHLRADVTPVELQMMLSAVARPVPRMPEATGTRLVERFVEVVIEGLRARPGVPPLPGLPVHREELLEAVRTEQVSEG
ncbi:TetR/AcrR family transcriptional regulator [Streptomyces sp. P38-E01]|uniref:TetR/AcrR family transcriptional regulator n=1 Tax=Streptomyces tardus TaxID=2780544 RepID=A0A949JBC3_9ACTN|nr:TetR/AcrR family transcriptional regulator [Streptomyces tardus]MBU7596651.1 TetR/AcrR family transcriptional regulator [Streptomyces tardus]